MVPTSGGSSLTDFHSFCSVKLLKRDIDSVYGVCASGQRAVKLTCSRSPQSVSIIEPVLRAGPFLVSFDFSHRSFRAVILLALRDLGQASGTKFSFNK